jgi:hypothetical protein
MKRQMCALLLCSGAILGLTTNGSALDERGRNALEIHDALLTGFFMLGDWRIQQDTTAALKTILPRAKERLLETGATGVLLHARYERRIDDEKYEDDAPVNRSQGLIGNRIIFAGEGPSPADAALLSLEEREAPNSLRAGREETVQDAQPGFRMYPELSQWFWVTRGKDGNILVEKVDNDKLMQDGRQAVLDKARVSQMKRASASYAIGRSIARFERQSAEGPLKAEAEALRLERDKALEELRKLDARLSEELDRANKANNAAAVFAITQALVGAGSSVSSAASGQSGISVGLRSLINERIKVGDKVYQFDQKIETFLMKNPG